MTIIIPLAGYGTRLRPLTFSTPKPLLLCAGDTILGWIFKSISKLSPSSIILIVGYHGEIIRDWVGTHYRDLPVEWVLQEEAKGLGHAVWKAGEVVSPETLLERGIIKKADARVKILAVGELAQPLTIRAHGFSAAAVAKIEAAGGKAEVI